MSVECRLHPDSPLPADALLIRFSSLSSSLISDVFGRWAGAPGLFPIAGLRPGQVMVGAALTVRTRAGDNLVVHKALEIIRPSEILVVAAGGAQDRAILGGLMGQYAQTQGVAGIVVDGAVRDRSDLEEIGLPVFARGISHLGPYKDGPGELRAAVSIAGLTVHDGDIIIGDEDGVAVIPRTRLEEILVAAEAKREAEIAESASITAGTWDRRWIDAAVRIVEVRE